MTAKDYAKALFDLEPQKKHLQALRASLKRSGREKLLPRIFAEYQKLALAQDRREQAAKVSPAQEKTRVLLELYRKLTHV